MENVAKNLSHVEFGGLVDGLLLWHRLQGRRAFDFDVFGGYLRALISNCAIAEIDLQPIVGEANIRIWQHQSLKFLRLLQRNVMGTDTCEIELSESTCKVRKGMGHAIWTMIRPSQTVNFYITRTELYKRIPRDASTLTAFFPVENLKDLKKLLNLQRESNVYKFKVLNIQGGQARLVGVNYRGVQLAATVINRNVETTATLNLPFFHDALRYLNAPVSIAVFPLLGRENAWVTETRGFADKEQRLPARVLEVTYAIDPEKLSENSHTGGDGN